MVSEWWSQGGGLRVVVTGWWLYSDGYEVVVSEGWSQGGGLRVVVTGWWSQIGDLRRVVSM